MEPTAKTALALRQSSQQLREFNSSMQQDWIFPGCTNNVAEYEGLLPGLRKARALGARRLSIKSDSELITNHIGKSYRELKPELAKYLAAVRSMEKCFLDFSVRSFLRLQTNRQMSWRRPQQKTIHCLRMCFFKHSGVAQ
jgi:ribonuclease HI